MGTQPSSPHIGFGCPLCNTRMFARDEHVGRRVRCPDCGHVSRVPPREKAATPQPPQAMDGAQYELWSLEEQPTGTELRDAQAGAITFECGLCDTRITVPSARVGQQIKCPDCGRVNIVPANLPNDKNSLAGFRTDWGNDEYELDPLSAPQPRPSQKSRDKEGATDTDVSPRNTRHPNTNSTPPRDDDEDKPSSSTRPALPRFPLLKGILGFPFSPGARVLWPILAFWSGLTVGIALFGYKYYAYEYGAVITVCLGAVAVILGIGTLAGLSACWLTILTESSDGNDVVQTWPDVIFLDWMFDSIFFISAAGVSLIPGWALAAAFQQPESVRWMGAAVGLVYIFPIVLLSMLEVGSAFVPFSPTVFGSLFRFPVSWLLVWFESTLLAASLVAMLIFLPRSGVLVAAVTVPTAVLCSFWYFRLLGRLGWVIAADSHSAQSE